MITPSLAFYAQSNRILRGLAVAIVAAAGFTAFCSAANLSFQKITLSTDFFCEGATFADLDHDGQVDAIAGPYWYAGPDFKVRHEIYPALTFDPLKYSDNFITFVYDFNHDGLPDLLVIGFPGVDASWYENPGKAGGYWRRHVVFMPVDGESPSFTDILGKGQPALICGSDGRFGYASMDPKDPTRRWTFHPISPAGLINRFTHATGIGDLNGDGRPDYITKEGWWEQPESLVGDPMWTFHPVPFCSADGGAQMLVTDLNGDGLADVITSKAAHGYGLSWFEQKRGQDGAISFTEHAILSTKADEKMQGVQFSQLHAVALADLDGDGLPDIVTGKRWWAHGPKGDPDPNGTPVIMAFLLRRGLDHTVRFEPQVIDEASGVGTQIVSADINHDGKPDLIAANKRGAFVFINQGLKDQK